MQMNAYIFPGQGSQYVGMGSHLYASYRPARTVFEQADRILGFALSRLCFRGPSEALNDTSNTQPAILAASIAALRALEEQEGSPVYVAGHSMGEFSALVAAGALSFEDGLTLVRERGRLMKEAGDRRPGGMAAILGLGRQQLESICAGVVAGAKEYVGIANDNCPGQIVISGSLEPLGRAMALAKKHGARRVIRLTVSIAAHSPLMDEAAAKFRHLLNATPFYEPAIPFVANTTAQPAADPEAIRHALGEQLTSPVRWTESVRFMIGQGVSRFVEVGPRDVLTGLMRRIDHAVERVTTSQVLCREA